MNSARPFSTISSSLFCLVAKKNFFFSPVLVFVKPRGGTREKSLTSFSAARRKPETLRVLSLTSLQALAAGDGGGGGGGYDYGNATSYNESISRIVGYKQSSELASGTYRSRSSCLSLFRSRLSLSHFRRRPLLGTVYTFFLSYITRIHTYNRRFLRVLKISLLKKTYTPAWMSVPEYAYTSLREFHLRERPRPRLRVRLSLSLFLAHPVA